MNEYKKAAAFDKDVIDLGGYLYSTNPQLSSQLAHGRISEAVLEIVDFSETKVLDIGCGDGVFTLEVFDRGKPKLLHGIDLAQKALNIAKSKSADRNINYAVNSAYCLPYPDDSFDIAHLRAVLHHMDYPDLAIKEALRVAKTIVVAEPNGNNIGVKLFEKLSAYHRNHQEKSYYSYQFHNWVKKAGCEIRDKAFVGLVPTFCPDWIARLAKLFEPILERIPILRTFGCSIYIFTASKE